MGFNIYDETPLARSKSFDGNDASSVAEQIFNQHDDNRDGGLSRKEMSSLLKVLAAKGVVLGKDEHEAMKKIDVDNNGKVYVANDGALD